MQMRGIRLCAVVPLLTLTGCKDDPKPRPDAGTPDDGGTANPTLSETSR
jgi:hypothetical protein